MADEFHVPVLLTEVIGALDVKPGKKYIDATIGGGGHALEIVKRGGELLGIDQDEEALEHIREKTRNSKLEIRNLTLVHGNFRDLGKIAKENGFEKVDGILLDIGVSGHQLQKKERGFSFLQDAPLDMRMDASAHSNDSGQADSGQQATAADLVNGLYEHELKQLFEKFGEERMARSIAHAISSARQIKRIETTRQLAGIIEEVYFGPKGATSAFAKASADKTVFQALRIAVNDELGSLITALPQAESLLEEGGKLAIISFHSLEDRIVKNYFKSLGVKTKPIVPTEEEIRKNARARSAKLRIYTHEKNRNRN